jgi:hypothetical protein
MLAVEMGSQRRRIKLQARMLNDIKSGAQGRCDGGESWWWWWWKRACVEVDVNLEAEVAEVVFEKARAVCCAR